MEHRSESLKFTIPQLCDTFIILGHCKGANFGRPPLESYQKIRACGFFEDAEGGFVLVSDGAPCYPKTAHELKLVHRSCNHSQGQFVAKSKVHNKSFKAHSGGVDSAWQLLKESMPKNVSTRAKGTAKFNRKIHTHIRAWQWQWRWGNTAVPNLCQKTAMAYLRQKNTWQKWGGKMETLSAPKRRFWTKPKKKQPAFQPLQQYVYFTK